METEPLMKVVALVLTFFQVVHPIVHPGMPFFALIRLYFDCPEGDRLLSVLSHLNMH